MKATPEFPAEFEVSAFAEEQRPHHNCGVAAVCNHSGHYNHTALIAAELLTHLQHRGPDGAGVAVMGEYEEHSIGTSNVGSVKEVLKPSNLSGLNGGEYSIGQVRYPTQGASGKSALGALQPIYGKGCNKEEFWVAHNGQFSGGIGEYSSDTSRFAAEVAHRFVGKTALEVAIVQTLSGKPKSSYSMVAMSRSGILAIRDPKGQHPLFYGYSEHLDSHLVASETPALSNLGVHDFQSVDPGFMVRLVQGKEPEVDRFVEFPEDPQLCALEAIYFARADGMLEDRHIYEMRRKMGALLAGRDLSLEADVVMPVPDSSRAAALGYAEASGLRCEEGFIKTTNDRSFLQPTQTEREKTASHKHQIIPSQTEGKRIVLVEDSIVRGTTLGGLIERLRTFGGAREVHLRIASPPIMWSCEYGIDIPTREELIAYREGGKIDAISKKLGADSLKYIEVADLRAGIGGELGSKACAKCFTGIVPRDHFIYRIPFAVKNMSKVPVGVR